MRLTLRTLLAWLDDTLPPSQVREIGRLVSESPFARELADRIHRVSRQRRHTVPSKRGPDSTDPNIVASYVDNDLEPELVAEYEKKCLTSDVNLAEVASVHQILSLLGQRVVVPPEAKIRMHQLVRGRESIPTHQPQAIKPLVAEPVTKPIQPWVAPEVPKQHWIERFGPLAGCLALLALLSWSAYKSLAPAPVDEVAQIAAVENGPGTIVAPTNDAAAHQRSAVPPEPSATAGPVEPEHAEKSASVAEKEKKDAESDVTAASPAREVPSGAVGVVDQAKGLLLRYNPENRDWARVAEGTSLAANDRLLNLAPFHSRIVLGSMTATLSEEAEIRLLSVIDQSGPRFELTHGRVILSPRGSSEKAGVNVQTATNQDLTINIPSGGLVGLERGGLWTSGQPLLVAPPIVAHVASGEVSFQSGEGKSLTLSQGGVRATTSGKLEKLADSTLPDWVNEKPLSEKAQKLGEDFLALFADDRPLLADMVATATDDESPVQRKYAIFGLKALGELSLLTPFLSLANHPDCWESAANALRAKLAQGPEAQHQVQSALEDEFGLDVAPIVYKLLEGYTADEANNREIKARLVDYLAPNKYPLAVRALALPVLMAATGRDAQGYDPNSPSEQSYNAWKSILEKPETKTATPRGDKPEAKTATPRGDAAKKQP